MVCPAYFSYHSGTSGVSMRDAYVFMIHATMSMGASACGLLEKKPVPVLGIQFIFESKSSQSRISLQRHRGENVSM